MAFENEGAEKPEEKIKSDEYILIELVKNKVKQGEPSFLRINGVIKKYDKIEDIVDLDKELMEDLEKINRKN